VTTIPVCIFAKPPVPGRVKTRLAQRIGETEAAELAAAMLADVWATVENIKGAVPVLAATEAGPFDIEVPDERIWLQPPGDLGWRIEGILRRGLESAPAVIALGADSPFVTALDLAQGIEHLQSGRTVLGPCDDGGFYLLGLHDCPPSLLAGIPWSSERTLQRTRSRLQMHGMRVSQLRTLFDVDTIADLQQLCTELESLPREVAPRTREWLQGKQWSALSFQR
jgi:uncharacterized protein